MSSAVKIIFLRSWFYSEAAMFLQNKMQITGDVEPLTSIVQLGGQDKIDCPQFIES